ncbi:hypothetical protein GcC1_178016 [Golovinomyces cichoracearum]|uniref:Uncharacterized protein n=1 Tax=Golovinomyces cichoracearum TaxID=62708 RepID=A0A420HNN6_9PEZI|nr:hypothetical protein GcC1_178016 [Golovinomyces cichoracearum]
MLSRLVDEHMNFSTEDTVDTSSMVDRDSNASKKSLLIQGISTDNSHSIQKSTLASQNLCSTKNEVFIIRRTSDSVPARSMSRRSIASSTMGSERDSVNEASIFARGIGFNTKRYVECFTGSDVSDINSSEKEIDENDQRSKICSSTLCTGIKMAFAFLLIEFELAYLRIGYSQNFHITLL